MCHVVIFLPQFHFFNWTFASHYVKNKNIKKKNKKNPSKTANDVQFRDTLPCIDLANDSTDTHAYIQNPALAFNKLLPFEVFKLSQDEPQPPVILFFPTQAKSTMESHFFHSSWVFELLLYSFFLPS